MAAALELEYLSSKRGRGAAAPWAPDRADSELALVQFTKHGAGTIAYSSSSSSSSHVKQAKPAVASRRMQLQQSSGPRSLAVAGSSKSAAGRHHARTDHDRLGQSGGDPLPLNTISLQSLIFSAVQQPASIAAVSVKHTKRSACVIFQGGTVAWRVLV